MPQVEIILPTAQKEAVRPTRIAAYCRVSSDSEDQLNSFYAQVRHYTTAIAELPNSVLVDIYSDEAVSGGTMEKREDFMRMIADCNKGKIDRILTKSVSRFARNTLECLETVRDLKLKGVSIYFEEQRIDTMKMGDELLITMFGSVAQSEAKSISRNVKIMNRKRMAVGEYVSNITPYGYRYADRTFIIQPEEAKVVRRIFAEYLAGNGPTIIAGMLNDEGVPAYIPGKLWHPKTIDRILHNEKYIGDTCHQKTFTTDDAPFNTKINRGELPKYYVEGTHEPIIEREVFEKAQALIARRNPPHEKTVDALPLSGVIRCGNCRCHFKRKMIRGKAYWICRKHNIRKEYCSMPQIPESELEDAFVTMFNKLKAGAKLILSPAISSLNELREATKRSNDELAAIDRRLVELNDKKLLLTKLRTRGIMQEKDYLTEISGVDQEMDKLRKERKKVLSGDDGLEQIAQLRHLQSILAENEVQVMFNIDMLLDIVDSITVESRERIIFRLLGGLELPEGIVEARK